MFFISYVSSRLKERWRLWEGVGVRWAHDKVGEGERGRSVGAQDMRKGGRRREGSVGAKNMR